MEKMLRKKDIKFDSHGQQKSRDECWPETELSDLCLLKPAVSNVKQKYLCMDFHSEKNSNPSTFNSYLG